MHNDRYYLDYFALDDIIQVCYFKSRAEVAKLYYEGPKI